MTLSRRALAAAARRMREQPEDVIEVVISLVLLAHEDGVESELTHAQIVAAVWWWRVHGETHA